MRRSSRTAVLAAALVLAAHRASAADPVTTSFTLTLNALDGEHAFASNVISRIDFVPLPLGEVSARSGRDELHVEGLPPVAFSYRCGSGVGATTTRLSIVNATYRRGIGGGWWVGVGQTLYNQHTTYAAQNGAFARFGTGGVPPAVYPILGAEEQYSRVTGPRFELGGRWALGGTSIGAIAAANPAMHGVQYTFIPTASHRACGAPACPPNPTFADPERAVQLDVAVRASRPVGRSARLLYGVRYLHYSSRYDDEPGELSDRNVAIAPLGIPNTALALDGPYVVMVSLTNITMNARLLVLVSVILAVPPDRRDAFA